MFENSIITLHITLVIFCHILFYFYINISGWTQQKAGLLEIYNKFRVQENVPQLNN